MGQGSFEMNSNLVSNAYANLVYVDAQKKIAQISFFPDNVCARLAASMMNEEFSLGKISGKNQNWWVGKAAELVNSKLCIPDRGDLGEVVAALWLLFVADKLRWSTSNKAFQFECSFLEVFLGMNGFVVNEKEEKKDKEENEGEESEEIKKLVKATISVWQVCRNYFRSPFTVYTSPSFLRYLYESGVGIYMYSACPTFDLLFSGKLGDLFFPIFVSVKAWQDVTKGQVKTLLNEMKKVNLASCPFSVRLLAFVGLNESKKLSEIVEEMKGEKREKKKKRNAKEEKEKEGKGESHLFGVVYLPTNDKWGFTDLLNATYLGTETTEIFISHSFLKPMIRDMIQQEANITKFLRVRAKLDATESLNKWKGEVLKLLSPSSSSSSPSTSSSSLANG